MRDVIIRRLGHGGKWGFSPAGWSAHQDSSRRKRLAPFGTGFDTARILIDVNDLIELIDGFYS